jgi:F0F1-type ATP synthase assembly protein I
VSTRPPRTSDGPEVDDPGAATEPKMADKSLGALFHEMTTDLGALVRKEIELAKVEARDEAKRAGKATAMFAVAGLGGWLAVLFVSLALAWLLDQTVNTALAFLIVGALWALIAALLFSRAKREVSALRPLPETTRSLKEDVQWAKAQKS